MRIAEQGEIIDRIEANTMTADAKSGKAVRKLNNSTTSTYLIILS